MPWGFCPWGFGPASTSDRPLLIKETFYLEPSTIRKIRSYEDLIAKNEPVAYYELYHCIMYTV